jgi:hypothetical protein
VIEIIELPWSIGRYANAPSFVTPFQLTVKEAGEGLYGMHAAVQVNKLPDQGLTALDFLCGMGFGGGKTVLRPKMRNTTSSSEFAYDQGQ